MDGQASTRNSSTPEINSAKEGDDSSFPNHLSPLEFGFSETECNVTYDLSSLPLEQYQNGVDAWPWMDTISKDSMHSSLDVAPNHNQCFPSSYSLNIGTEDDFSDIYELYNGFNSQNQEIISVINSSGFRNQNQPLLITNTEDNNGGQITNTILMNGNEEIVDFDTEFMQLTDPITMEEERVENDTAGTSSSSSNIRLSKETISKYFYMTIKQTAKELNVGSTQLKKRCRELGIQRWPRRKLLSMQTLINNVQELSKESDEGTEKKMREAISTLERERKQMEEIPDLQLEQQTKLLRQACFKSIYKKRKTKASSISQTTIEEKS